MSAEDDAAAAFVAYLEAEAARVEAQLAYDVARINAELDLPYLRSLLTEGER